MSIAYCSDIVYAFLSYILGLLCISIVLGKKNGKGFYIYRKGLKPKPDSSVLPIIEESRRLTNIMAGGKVLLLHINTRAIPFP